MILPMSGDDVTVLKPGEPKPFLSTEFDEAPGEPESETGEPFRCGYFSRSSGTRVIPRITKMPPGTSALGTRCRSVTAVAINSW